jgi:hypothetical protein
MDIVVGRSMMFSCGYHKLLPTGVVFLLALIGLL